MATCGRKYFAHRKSEVTLSENVFVNSISGLVVEYIVAIDVTWVRFPADAFSLFTMARGKQMTNNCISVIATAGRH